MVTQFSSPDQIKYQPPQPIPGITFRLAHHHDLKTLWEKCYPKTIWDQFLDHYEFLLKWQQDGRSYILIAETTSQSDIIASGQLIRQVDKAEIAELVVRDAYQNRGIGTAVIHILTQLAIEQQLRLLEIGVSVENGRALRLYRRLGFANERRVQLPGAGEALFLSKIINNKES